MKNNFLGAASQQRRFTQTTVGAYDAVDNRQRRRVKVANLKSEDNILQTRDRDKLVSDGRNLRRNAPDVAWAVRKHLDYVSTFTFQCRSGVPELDARVEELMDWWSRPFNCDVTARHSLPKLIRMAEGLATVEGDVFVMKLSDGKVQIIEGDRVRTPQDLGDFKQSDIDLTKFVHGVEVTEAGKAVRYAICDRTPGGTYILRALVPAEHVYQLGYFDRYDQIRGVSPLASAINTFADMYEAREYALAKMKLSQIFALKMTLAGEGAEAEEGEPYSFDFGTGPQTLQLSPGDDADFLETNTPSNEFQAFLQTGIQIGLKALDIPYSFFSEDFTNYSGARQALLQYEQSCEEKRDRIRLLLNGLTAWRLALFIADGYLTLPEGFTLDQVKWEWIPAAIAWIDPQKEATAQTMLISNKLASRQQIAKANGQDWFSIVDQLAAEEEYMRSKGLSVDVPQREEPDGVDPQQVADAVVEAQGNKGNK